MGAVFDPVTYESTLRIGNLHQLEVLTHKLQPKWPVDVLGAIDENKAQQGEQIFDQKCLVCHQDKMFAQMEIGMDPNRANSFGQAVGTTPFPKAIAPILSNLKKRAFADDGISAAEQAGMDANPVIWRVTAQYLARPLNGIGPQPPFSITVPCQLYMIYFILTGARRNSLREIASSIRPRSATRMTSPPPARIYGFTIQSNPAIATSVTAAAHSARHCPKIRRPRCWNISRNFDISGEAA
jgi:hypothetical protein